MGLKRNYALGVLAALTVLAVVLLWTMPKSGTWAKDRETAADPGDEVSEEDWETVVDPGNEALIGSWETTMDPGNGTSEVVRCTFDADGTCTSVRESPDGERRTQANYRAREDRLYLSRSLDYSIDPDVYDRFRLEGDKLTLLENSADRTTGHYPMTLTRVAEE